VRRLEALAALSAIAIENSRLHSSHAEALVQLRSAHEELQDKLSALDRSSALQALRRLAEAAGETGRGVTVGVYLTSPRAAAASARLLTHAQVAWLEVRVLQAMMFGLPARQLLTQQPLDEYLRRGLLSTDPRRAIDPSADSLLATVASSAAGQPGCPVGLRLSGAVAEDLAASLYGHGFRRFAVDSHEIQPLVLALGRAALSS